MSFNWLKSILIFFISALLFSSCSEDVYTVDQGVISYDITYPKPFKDKWMEKMMPKDMDMYFKNSKVNASLSFGLGMIKIGYITDNQKKELHELLKFMRNKNVSHKNLEQTKQMIASLPRHTITLKPDTKTVAGFLCKKAEIIVDNPNGSYTYDAWYTDKINIKDPNWCTPFGKIPGVLLEYQVERMDVIMRFEANHITYEEIKDDEFTIPPKYSEITGEDMEKRLEELKDI